MQEMAREHAQDAAREVPCVRLRSCFGVATIGNSNYQLSTTIDKILGRKVFSTAFMEYPPLNAVCDSNIVGSFVGRHELRNGGQLRQLYLEKFGTEYAAPHGRHNSIEYDVRYRSELVFEPVAGVPFRPGLFNWHTPAPMRDLVVLPAAPTSEVLEKLGSAVLERVFARARVPLYKFQQDGVRFLLQRELERERRVRYWFTSGYREIVIPGYDRCWLENAPDVRIECISSRGGLLADEMGLGKTLTVILASLAASELRGEALPLDESPEAHRKTTLVLCPKHLIRQWAAEFELVEGCGEVCVLRTATDFKKMHQKIAAGAFAFLVVPYSFFNSDVYQREVNRRPSCCLGRVQFARVVFDEVHELFSYNRQNEMQYELPHFDAPHVHLVSATPYRHMQDIVALLYLLRADLQGEIAGRRFSAQEGAMSLSEYRLNAAQLPPAFLERALHEVLMVRHTKRTLEEKLEIGEFTEETVLLEFSSEERKVYDSLLTAKEDADRLQRFCCYYNLEEKKAADMANAVSLEDAYELRVQELERALAKARGKAAQVSDDGRNRVSGRLREKVAALEFQLARLHEAFRGTGAECPICLGPIQSLLMTNCGHFFCSACIERAARKSAVCPVCREPLAANRCCVRGARAPEVQRFGTKLGNLVVLVRSILREAPAHRVLIFSQYDTLLAVIASILEGAALPAVYPHGNVHSTNKQLADFLSSEGKRVLLLSMNNCASGSNMKCISHVVFLDNIVRDAVRNELMMMQGIGRAVRLGKTDPVRVYHLKVRDTVEHPE